VVFLGSCEHDGVAILGVAMLLDSIWYSKSSARCVATTFLSFSTFLPASSTVAALRRFSVVLMVSRWRLNKVRSRVRS
jgi:hypothetical protein